MSKIKVLSPSVAEKIAAGEVVERPSSVVKELVENSLDAGATEIAVHLEDGGKGLIEVLDNGGGMSPEDLALCLRRHATSKLETLEDLDRVHTLGFRGEALASIAAVSELRITSRADSVGDQPTAYEITAGATSQDEPRLEKITFGHFLGKPHGTRIRARGLFSQIPARLKFLKSASSEVSQVREWLERLALTHPQVGFRLMSEDRTLLNLRPQDEVARVKAILADGEEYPVVSREGRDEHGVSARIHWLQGLSSPQTRKLVQVVNRRAVRDRLLQQALLNPFRQALLPGQFPAVALFLEVSPSGVDVNVHPTKAEIRFLESGKVFRTVTGLVETAIAEHGAPAIAPAQAWSFSDSSPTRSSSWQPPLAWSLPPTTSSAAPDSMTSPSISSEPRPHDSLQAAPSRVSHPFQSAQYLGIAFQTYLLYDLGHELGLIDQHAAHERIRYETLKRRLQGAPAASLKVQELLIPEAVKFPADQRTRLEARLPVLSRLGFSVEIFGEDAALFRALPAEWGSQELRTRLKNLIERLLDWDSGLDNRDPTELLLDGSLFERLASEACHSAIRAGDRLDACEAHALVEQLFECEHPWNCPHGRPTVARIPRGKFEEWFQRRV